MTSDPAAMRQLPAYWMPRPATAGKDGEAERFDALLRQALDAGPDDPIDYRLPDPKWRFLSHLTDAGQVETIDDPDGPLESAQAASGEPVTPLAKLVVEPQDFPFLQEIRVHDPQVVIARATAHPDGFPWLDEF